MVFFKNKQEPSPVKNSPIIPSAPTQGIIKSEKKLEVELGTADEPFLFKTRPVLFERRKSLPKEFYCIICWAGTKEMVFLPCWHQISCSECASKLSECPLCREPIQQTKKPFKC